MTIIFLGNNFKYEAEAVAKLFFSATTFTFLYEEASCEDDYCLIQRTITDDTAALYVVAKINGIEHSDTETIKTSNVNYEKSCEFILCRLIFNCLSTLTGITPQWGMLTGIRPVKKISALLDDGKSKEEIHSYFKENYYVSDSKIDLAYKTAIIQKPLLKIPENSFSLYVSIPFCPTRCSYCSFVSHSMNSAIKLMPQYIQKLKEEISITAKIAHDLNLNLDTVYFGGGTPTSISAEELSEIMNAVSSSFNLSLIREYTVEAGRADTITKEKLETIYKNGATRISINPQTMNDDVLKSIKRKHTVKQFVDAYNIARDVGFDNINMDLIAGLPTDTTESFFDSVSKVIALKPENITIHTLTLKRSSTLFHENTNELKQSPVNLMTSFAQQKLTDNGYNPYYLYRQKNTIENLENVGYAKPNYESLYNIFIMDEIQTILAVGAAASTKLCAPNGKIERVYNYKFPYEYIGRFNTMIDKKKEIYNFYNNL